MRLKLKFTCDTVVNVDEASGDCDDDKCANESKSAADLFRSVDGERHRSVLLSILYLN